MGDLVDPRLGLVVSIVTLFFLVLVEDLHGIGIAPIAEFISQLFHQSGVDVESLALDMDVYAFFGLWTVSR